MTTASRPFDLPNPADANRLWLMDRIHNPRALPPLASDLNVEWVSRTPLEMDAIAVNGYTYSSPRSMQPPPAPEALPPGQALRNWEGTFLPACQQVVRRFREQDYASMAPEEILSFIERERPRLQEALFNTIVSAMQLGPDAERLSVLLEAQLGAEGDLLAATILHGGGSQTRSLGDEVEALAEAARATPVALDALKSRDFERALAVNAEPWAGALRAFLEAHADEVGLWSEIHVPAWNEDPIPLLRMVASTVASPRNERREDGSAAAMAEVRARLAPEHHAEFEAAVALSRDYVPIIEHRARWQLKMIGSHRRAWVALARSLVARGLADNADELFFIHLAEIPDAITGRLDIRALARERKATWETQLTLEPPSTLGLPIPLEMVGAMSPMMRRMFGAVALPAATATVVSGIPASSGVVTGRARVVGGLAEADNLEDGDILVCPSTSPPWTPYFAIVAAVVTDAGGVISHAAIEAREYGIPAVVGTREGTRRIPDGATITVDGGAGTITIEP